MYAPAILLVVSAFLLAYQFVDPAPPSRLVIATGAEEGAYAAFARRYRDIFARERVELEIRHTKGSVENLSLLAAGEVDVAFAQGGVLTHSDTELLSIGSLYFEPGWLFYRSETDFDRLTDFQGVRLAIGVAGSGTRVLAQTLLDDNASLAEGLKTVEIGGRAAADALTQGEVDGAFFVSGVDSPLINELIHEPGIRLMSFRRAAAYSRLHPYLSPVLLPEGVIDMAANIPDRELRLVAPAATLVTNNATHPALLDLLLQAVKQVHGGGGWFEQEGQFPSKDYLVFPLSPEAERFYQHGAPFLQRYLPFWAATLVDRLKVMLLPLVVILIPLMRIMPPIYNWRMRARIYRWYKELELIEERIRIGLDENGVGEVRAELAAIDEEVQKVHVPLSFAAQAYELRMHIRLVRRTVKTE